MQALSGELRKLYSISISETVDGGSEQYLAAETSIIWTLSQLRSLSVTCAHVVTPSILRSLSQFSSLRSLSLAFKLDEGFDFSFPGGSFTALRDLNLESDITCLHTLIDTIPIPRVKALRLVIYFTANNSWDDLRKLSSVYSKLPTSLRRLNLTVVLGSQCGRGMYNLVPSFDIFVKPLQSFRNLRELAVTVGIESSSQFDTELSQCGLTDSYLRSLTAAWPELGMFGYSLSPLAHPHRLPLPPRNERPTVGSVLAFAYAHPRLKHLELPYVDEDSCPFGGNRHPLGTFPAHALLGLKIGRSICAPERKSVLMPIARTICRAFPLFEPLIDLDERSPDEAFSEALERELLALQLRYRRVSINS